MLCPSLLVIIAILEFVFTDGEDMLRIRPTVSIKFDKAIDAERRVGFPARAR